MTKAVNVMESRYFHTVNLTVPKPMCCRTASRPGGPGSCGVWRDSHDFSGLLYLRWKIGTTSYSPIVARLHPIPILDRCHLQSQLYKFLIYFAPQKDSCSHLINKLINLFCCQTKPKMMYQKVQYHYVYCYRPIIFLCTLSFLLHCGSFFENTESLLKRSYIFVSNSILNAFSRI